MRALFGLLIAVGLLAACEERPAAPEPLQRRLGLRAPDDPLLRTTAGAGTSGLHDPVPAPVDGTSGTTSDPTTGSTNGAPERTEPVERGGTTGTSGGLVPSAPRADRERLPA